jgi:hypothetical protein
LKEGDNFEDAGLDENIILKWILGKWDGRMDWIDLVQYRDRRQALVNAVIKLRVQ